jgi:hypothetical protein
MKYQSQYEYQPQHQVSTHHDFKSLALTLIHDLLWKNNSNLDQQGMGIDKKGKNGGNIVLMLLLD